MWRVSSISVGCAAREKGAERSCVVDGPLDGRASEQPGAIGGETRKGVADRMHPVGIEECRRRCAVGERKSVACGPFTIRQARLEPCVASVQHSARLFDALYVVAPGVAQAIAHD